MGGVCDGKRSINNDRVHESAESTMTDFTSPCHNQLNRASIIEYSDKNHFAIGTNSKKKNLYVAAECQWIYKPLDLSVRIISGGPKTTENYKLVFKKRSRIDIPR